MNLIIKIIIFCYLGCMVSCIPADEPVQSLMVGFWTDMAIDSTAAVKLLINDEIIGDLTYLPVQQDCDNSQLVNYLIPFDSTIVLAIQDVSGNVLDLASMEIFNVNTGLSFDRFGNSQIEIDGTTDDRCTQIYLSW